MFRTSLETSVRAGDIRMFVSTQCPRRPPPLLFLFKPTPAMSIGPILTNRFSVCMCACMHGVDPLEALGITGPVQDSDWHPVFQGKTEKSLGFLAPPPSKHPHLTLRMSMTIFFSSRLKGARLTGYLSLESRVSFSTMPQSTKGFLV